MAASLQRTLNERWGCRALGFEPADRRSRPIRPSPNDKQDRGRGAKGLGQIAPNDDACRAVRLIRDESFGLVERRIRIDAAPVLEVCDFEQPAGQQQLVENCPGRLAGHPEQPLCVGAFGDA